MVEQQLEQYLCVIFSLFRFASFIWKLFHMLSKAFYFFTYEIIDISGSTTNIVDFEKYWIKHYGNQLGVFSYFSRDDLFNNHKFKTNMRLSNNNNTGEN